MRLIGLAVIFAVSLILAPLAAGAQPATKVPRVGILIAGSSPGQSYLGAFRQGCTSSAMWKVRASLLNTDGRSGSTNASPTSPPSQPR